MHEFKVEHYANFGTGEPWVARIVLGLQELVYAVPALGPTREAFMNELGEVLESLGMAFEELRGLRRLVAEKAPGLDIARAYASLYGYLWQAYKDRFQAALKALGPRHRLPVPKRRELREGRGRAPCGKAGTRGHRRLDATRSQRLSDEALGVPE